MKSQENAFFFSRNLLLPAALSVVALSSTPTHDSYRESLLLRQLNRDCRQECHNLKLGEQRTAENEQITNELSAHEILVEFKNDGFPIATIASIAGVERKTVYAWLNGAVLREENEARIYELHTLLSHNKIASYRNLYRYMNRKIEGKTLASSLSESTLDHHLVVKLLERLWPLAQKTEKSLASNGKNMKKNNPVIDGSLEV